MADSKDNNNSSDDFADDLDALLNDVGSSNNTQDELIDDEDAIDRLLMDDSLDDAGKDTTEIQDDEFAEDTNEQEVDEFDVDDLINSSIASDPTNNEDEFAEIDEFADKNNSVTTEQQEETIAESSHETDEFAEEINEPQAESDSDSTDDFLMADFDISTDDEDELEEDNIPSNIENSDAISSQTEESFDSEIAEQESKAATPNPSQAVPESTQSNAIFDELNAQINQLWADNENLKQQIAELSDSSNQDNAMAEELENLEKEQRKLRKSFRENEGKVPIATFVAIGIAILALLVGGGLGAIGYGAQSDVTDLTELITTLEEEIEILSAKDTSADIKKINDKIDLLIAKDDDLNKHLENAKKAIQSSNLKPVVDDLVIQNDHAQVAIEQLLAKVDTLEKRKFVKPKLKKPRKVVAKVMWVVNLVSFKQEWYAKRKATEFDKKGIPAEVIKVIVKGENWFRLRVRGFKSKYEAAAYAVKVKKTLNLSSVWVTKA